MKNKQYIITDKTGYHRPPLFFRLLLILLNLKNRVFFIHLFLSDKLVSINKQ